MKIRFSILLLVLVITSCTTPATETLQTTLPTPTPALATMTPFKPQPMQATIAPSITPVPTQTSAALNSPYAIPALRQRTYGGGNLTFVNEQHSSKGMTYAGFQYPSDGLSIYGRMSVPDGEGPYPVIIAIHGFNPRNEYADPNYSLNEFDGLVRDGYIVIHPNMRNYPPSEDGNNLYRVGMSIDILNLLEIVKSQAGQPGLLEKADASRLGLWAHSMGGEIALRVLTISPDIDAALLYAPLGGDTLENSLILYGLDPQPPLNEEVEIPQLLLTSIAPMYHYNHISAAMRLFHGEDDVIVPVSVSETTCDLLEDMARNIQCTFVPGQGHTFRSSYSSTFMRETLSFYESYLKNAQ